jgi:predicted alpha/beta superfamily hydrolase
MDHNKIFRTLVFPLIGIDHDKIFIFGRSLGGAVAMDVAYNNQAQQKTCNAI